MAQENYSAAPKNAPEAKPPEDYFTPRVSAETFGGHIATGLQQLGQGLQQGAETWTEMRKDALLNSAYKEAEAAAEEYDKLQGSDAVAAENTYKQRIDQIGQHYGSQLPGKWQTEFDSTFRPYQYRTLYGKISTHAITQGNEVTKQTNEATGTRAGDMAANNYNDPDQINSAIELARSAAIKQVQANGNENVPGVVQMALKNADAYVYKRVAEAMYSKEPVRAAKFVEDNKEKLGGAYPILAREFGARARKIQEEQKADVIQKINQEPDPTTRAGMARANAAIIGDDLVRQYTGEQPQTRQGNVIPFSQTQGKINEILKEATPAPQPNAPLKNPTPKLKDETMQQWYERNSSQNYSPTQNFAATSNMANSAAQQAISNAMPLNVNAHTDRNLFSSGAAKRRGIEGGIGQNLVSIGTNPADKEPVMVNARAAPHFKGFIDELEAMGYKIHSLGGYSPRMKAGSLASYSEHAFGNAIDINPDRNPFHSHQTDLPKNISLIAARHGLIWGGDWTGNSADPMHFEWSGKEAQTAGQ